MKKDECMMKMGSITVAQALLLSVLPLFLVPLPVIKAQGIQPYPPQQITEQPIAGSPMGEGSIKRLACRAFSYPQPVYTWIKDGTILRQNRTDPVYQIDSLRISDAGEYRCLISNQLGAVLSHAADVQVAYLRQLPQQSTQQVTADQGDAVILPLPAVDSVPAPDIEWKEDNSTLSTETFYHSVTLNKSVVLLSVSTSDSGKQYQARALNVITNQQTTSHALQLTVRGTGDVSTHIQPQLIIAPVDAQANRGSQKVEFECVFNARPINYLNVDWYRVTSSSRRRIYPSSKYILTPFKRQLLIKLPGNDDIGSYECEASLNIPGGPTYPSVSARAALTLRESPSITPGTGVVEKDYSETVHLSCLVMGQPTPTLQWYFNGRPVASLQRSRHTVFTNGTLVIENVDLPDAGVYQCFAENDVGEASDSTWLKVNSSPPKFKTAPHNLTVVEKNEARFPCEVTGAPKPSVSWFRVSSTSETKIESGGRFQILDRELLITSTEKIDSGIYKCMAANIKGNISAQATLQVIVKTEIIRPPQNITAILSTMVTLECGVSHDDSIRPSWEWFFYKAPAYEEEKISSSGKYQITVNGSLIINGVAGEDIGKYKCFVVSAGGNDSRIAKLSVIELPAAPVIISVALELSQNNSVRITWNHAFDGNSPLQRYIISYREEDPNGNNNNARWIVYPDNISPSLNSYVVRNLKPSRHYKFKISAVNSVGEGEASQPKPDPAIQMPAQPPSSPPKNFYCSPRADRAILVQWQAPDEDSWNGELLGFKIHYKLASYPDNTAQVRSVDDRTVTSYILDNLVYYKQYELRIAAYNAEGVGVFSSGFRVWTQEGRPSAPPRDLALSAFNSTTINATWLPPPANQINGVNQGYTIELKRTGQSQTERAVFIPSDPNNLYGEQKANIYNLLKYTEYEVTITCRTTQGPGPKSGAVTVRTQEDVPGEVGDLKFDNIRDRSLRVSWTPPQEINGELQGYTVTHEVKNQSSTSKSINLLPSFTSYTIQDLNPVTMYTIYVFARTRKGPGPAKSADIKSGVPPELPERPHHLGITNILARSVLLQFLPGYDGKTSITLWIVEGLEGTSTKWKVVFTKSDPTAREILVENLRPYTTYRLRLIAQNIVGRSNASDPTRSFQTQQAAPGTAPGNVTVRALNATSLRVSWTPLPKHEWNGAPKGYKIFYRMKPEDPVNRQSGRRKRRQSPMSADFQVVLLENGINVDSYIITSLEEWMDYEVKMSAYTDVGAGINSTVTVERTRESVPSSSPQNVEAFAESSTSINVTWKEVPRLNQNGLIQGYKVKYASQEENIPAEFQEVVGNESFWTTLTGLRKFVQYEIQVLAFTRMGDGTLSPARVVRTIDDLPGPPVIIYFPSVTYSSARVVWNPPLEPNGIITGYRVSYRKQSETSIPSGNSVELGPATMEHTVDGLDRETYYVFIVTAKTRLGWGESASVLVYTMMNRDRPDSPSKPKIGSSQVQARSVVISWSPGNDNYGPIRNYTVQYKARGGTWIALADYIPPENTSHNITNLRPNTWYQFQVAATNDIGSSDYSPVSPEVQTLPDRPEGAPQNVQVYAVSRTSINVSWEQPPVDTWNGQIVGYVIQYRQIEMTDYQEETVPFSRHSFVLHNLAISVYYEVRIEAYNAIGRGPPSKPTTIYVGEAAPTASPLNVMMDPLSSSEIRVSWQPPPPDTQNGGLSGYKVTFWTESESPQQVIAVETSLTLDKLEIYTMYYCTVQAYNLAGEGPSSPVQNSRTQEGVPTAPASLTFSDITLTKLMVSWKPPTKPNGKIQSYELVYFLKKTDLAETKLVQLTLNGSQHSILIKDLEEYSNYTFRISASTSQGKSPYREGNVTTGPQKGSPDPPGQPDVEVRQTSFVLRWENRRPGETPIYGYLIQGKSENDDKWKTKLEKDSEDPQAVVSYHDLTPNSHYQFRVIAKNSKGISYPSRASEEVETPSTAVAAVAKPFHSQWWFLVIIALTGVILILVIISLLCLVGRRNKKNDAMKRSQTTSSMVPEPEPEEGGFASLELRQSRRSLGLRNGSVKNIYARSPPRPSPASVTYSDDDLAAKGGIADDNSSSLTEKPSDLDDDSTQPSEDESDEESTTKVPASPAPPAFGSHYATNDAVHQSWRFQNPYNAYAYTDSEADSSHYATSLNGGRLVLNNAAGSRTPLAGFSSFV